MNVAVLRYRQRLDTLFQRASAFEDLELLAHWARYLCVLASGFLEVSVQSIYGEYARTKSHPNVTNFVQERLKQFQSAKMRNICDLARTFNPEWGKELEVATEGALKDAVDSIVANRHLIAHGKDVGISFARIKDYYDRATQVVELIEAQCA